MSQVTFREATAADLPTLLALLADDAIARERTGYVAEPTPEARAAFDEITADPNNVLVVGERLGEVVACLQLTFIPGLSRGGMRRALVEAVRVRADLRGQRIGEQLMGAVFCSRGSMVKLKPPGPREPSPCRALLASSAPPLPPSPST